LLGQGKYQQAIPIAKRAVELAKRTWDPEDPNTAETIDNLAVLYANIGEYAEAEPLYQEALRINQKVWGREHPRTVKILNNLGVLYQNAGKYVKAEPLFQEALRINQKVLGSENPYTLISLNNLAELYKDMGEYAKAEPLLQQALRIRQKDRAESYQTATSLNDLGLLYDTMGEYAKAEQLDLEALRIYQKVLGPEHPSTVTSLDNLGVLYEETGQYAKAEPLDLEALRIRQKVLGSEHPSVVTSLNSLAILDFDRGRINEATALARQASAAELTILSKIFAFTSEEQRLAYLGIFHPYGLFPILTGTETDLATAVLRYKGVVLDSIVEDRLLPEASQGSEDQNLVEQLNLDKRQLGQLLLQPSQKLSEKTNQQIETLEAEVEKIEGQLAQRVTGLGRTRRALGVSLAEVQSTIPNDGALVEYLRYGHYLGKGQWVARYGAIVLFSKDAPLWIQLGKASEIVHLVRRYGALVRGAPEDEELSANLQALYEALWAPIG
jgi:tetratricopeptide (TPR) repeat protein